MKMSSSVRFVLPVVLLGLTLTGCTSETPGDPKGTDTPTAATTKDSSPASPKPSNGANPLANLNACDLMKSASGLTDVKDLGTPKRCNARTADRVLVGLDLQSGKKIENFVGGPNSKATELTIGKHKASLIDKAGTDTACAVSIAVGENDRVDFISTGVDLNKTCDAAKTVATAVEPKLP